MSWKAPYIVVLIMAPRVEAKLCPIGLHRSAVWIDGAHKFTPWDSCLQCSYYVVGWV